MLESPHKGADYSLIQSNYIMESAFFQLNSETPFWTDNALCPKKEQCLSQKKKSYGRTAFHDLRHTFATVALQNGVDIRTVSGMLGHTDPGFTLRTYTHATNPMQVHAAETIGKVMAGRR